MLAQIAEYVRTQTLADATLSSPIDRSYVAPGDRWAVESCRQWVIHFAGSRREALGGQRVPAPQQGVGFPGPLASAPVFDLVASFVACGYPEWDDETPADAQAINTWTLAWLADVEALGVALAELVLPVSLVGVPGLKLSLGSTTQTAPDGGTAKVSWPLSVEAAAG
jgi:hypothetical protein